MKLQVNIFEARELSASKGSFIDPYVKIQLGRTVSSTSVVHASFNPCFNEEFSFRVDDLQSEVLITVCDKDSGFSEDFLGRVKVPVSKVLHAEKLTLPPSWYPLQQRSNKSKKHISGEILLSFSLYGGTSKPGAPYRESTSVDVPGSPRISISTTSSSSDISRNKLKLGQRVSAFFNKKSKLRVHPSANGVVEPGMSEDGTISEDEPETLLSFDDENSLLVATDEGIPPPLPGGILLDQTYGTTMKNLNSILFKPGTEFYRDVYRAQKTTEFEESPWTKNGNEAPKRVVSYRKAATALVKSVRATEEQTYLKADDKAYVVLASVSTPDVPYGTNFRTELQFCITPVIPFGLGEDWDSDQEICRLRISWRVNFLQSIMIRGLVENGAKQGLKDNFQQFAEVLSRYATPVQEEDFVSSKMEVELPKTDWELFTEYIRKPVVIVTFILSCLMMLHIFLASSSRKSGLEFWELDLPDSFCELLTASLLALQVDKIFKIGLKFLKVRVCVGGDHGIKAKGEGWLLTVTLVEAENLPEPDGSNCLDPYVVFTCSGKTRTSSVKIQTTQPTWREIFEFDATEDPPSTLELEVFDYDGPFPDGESLGSAEINFLKHPSNELADTWIKLRGRRAQACASRVHLRIFLTNTKDSDVIMETVKRVEKEVGTKIERIPAKKNSSFQKLFSLPAEEFLINDFSCAIKRKIPLQGRMFLSPRMLGFYSSIFGHKTKFGLLWEDIEEVKELQPSFANVGISIVVFTRKGRARDARECAKNQDPYGRLKFQFQSFVRPGPAFRTVFALWKNRNLTPEQQIKMVPTEDLEAQGDNGEFLGVEDAKLTEVYSTEMPFTAASMSAMYERENLEEKIMEKAGCTNYTVSPWENVNGKPLVQQRQVNYKFNRRLCQFGSNVSGIQQKETSVDKKRIAVDCILTLHDVPFGDNFQIHVRKEIETFTVRPPRGHCKVYVGLAWQKGTCLQNRISSNVFQQFTKHLKEEMELTAKAVLEFKDHRSYVLV